MTVKEAIDRLKYDRAMCYFDPNTGADDQPYSEDCKEMAEALDIAIEALENAFGEQSEQETVDEKYHHYPKSEMRLKEILPLIRSAGYSNRDELGYSITLCPECEEWTWVKLNASSCLLDALGDLRVESINAEDGNFKVWIITDDYNWFRSPEEKTGKWIHVNKLWYKCSECDAHREMIGGFLENFCPYCGAKMESDDESEVIK